MLLHVRVFVRNKGIKTTPALTLLLASWKRMQALFYNFYFIMARFDKDHNEISKHSKVESYQDVEKVQDFKII